MGADFMGLAGHRCLGVYLGECQAPSSPYIAAKGLGLIPTVPTGG